MPAIFIWNISTGKVVNICTGHKLITSIAELGGDHDLYRHNFLYAMFCVSRHKNAKYLKVHILFIVYIYSEEHTWSKVHQHCLDDTVVKRRRSIRPLHQIRQLFSQDEEESQRLAPVGPRGDIILATQSLARDLFADILVDPCMKLWGSTPLPATKDTSKTSPISPPHENRFRSEVHVCMYIFSRYHLYTCTCAYM